MTQLNFFKCLLWCVLFFIITPIDAQTAYITDQGDFNLRSGESIRHKIIRVLNSGVEVEILSENAATGYSRIRLNDGTVGFILTRYLQPEPAAREQLEVMQARLDELQQAPDQLATKLNNLQQEHSRLSQEYEDILHHNQTLEQELIEIRRSAANVVNITQERAALQEDVANLTRKVGELEQENLELRYRDKLDWFLTGSIVAVGCIIIGIFLPNLRFRRRRSSWSSF
jgi:SH3 domain protein